jgi:hypothetical protein
MVHSTNLLTLLIAKAEAGVTAGMVAVVDLAIEVKATAEGDVAMDFMADEDIQPHIITADVALLWVTILLLIRANFLSKSVIRSIRIAIHKANRAEQSVAWLKSPLQWTTRAN